MNRPSPEAITRAGAVLARGRAAAAERTPHEQALLAYVPNGPSVAEIEDRIRRRRGLEPLLPTDSPAVG